MLVTRCFLSRCVLSRWFFWSCLVVLIGLPDGVRGDDELPPLPRPQLRDLRGAATLLEQEPLLVPLMVGAHLGRNASPWTIVVLRDALASPDAWVQAIALRGLVVRKPADLITLGGRELADLLGERARTGSGASRRVATGILDRLHQHRPELIWKGTSDLWVIDRDAYPAGRTLPSPKPESPGPDGSQPKDRGKTHVPGGSPQDLAAAARFGAESGDRGLDIVWNLDCTGSMTRHFQSALEGTERVATVIDRLLGEVRHGWIAYRDRAEVRMKLGADVSKLSSTLGRLRADRGGSPDERVDLAFDAARSAKMGWNRSGPCAMVFIGDAGPKAKHASPLLRGVKKVRRKWKTLHVHCVRMGMAAFPGAAEFWNELARAGDGVSVAGAPGRDLVVGLCVGARPRVDTELLRQVLQVIWETEGWDGHPGGGTGRDREQAPEPVRRDRVGA